MEKWRSLDPLAQTQKSSLRVATVFFQTLQQARRMSRLNQIDLIIKTVIIYDA